MLGSDTPLADVLPIDAVRGELEQSLGADALAGDQAPLMQAKSSVEVDHPTSRCKRLL